MAGDGYRKAAAMSTPSEADERLRGMRDKFSWREKEIMADRMVLVGRTRPEVRLSKETSLEITRALKQFVDS